MYPKCGMATSARDFEHRDVHARDNTEGLYETVRESTLKVDWKKNALPHQGVEPASAARKTQRSVKTTTSLPQQDYHSYFLSK